MFKKFIRVNGTNHSKCSYIEIFLNYKQMQQTFKNFAENVIVAVLYKKLQYGGRCYIAIRCVYLTRPA